MDYLREKIKGASYSLSGGITFNIAMNMSPMNLSAEDLFADTLIVVRDRSICIEDIKYFDIIFLDGAHCMHLIVDGKMINI
jgi:hypothetical protein